jgi:hypothetical protein
VRLGLLARGRARGGEKREKREGGERKVGPVSEREGERLGASWRRLGASREDGRARLGNRGGRLLVGPSGPATRVWIFFFSFFLLFLISKYIFKYSKIYNN